MPKAADNKQELLCLIVAISLATLCKRNNIKQTQLESRENGPTALLRSSQSKCLENMTRPSAWIASVHFLPVSLRMKAEWKGNRPKFQNQLNTCISPISRKLR